MNYKIVPPFGFNFLTRFYDLLTESIGFGKKLKRKVLKLAKIKNGQSVLDVGCGTGALLIIVKEMHPNSEVVGIDPDKTVFNLAMKKIGKVKASIQLKRAYGEKLPFGDSKFDVITNVLVLHHLPTKIKIKVLSEMHRCLKPNGKVVIADFGKPKNTLWKIILLFEKVFDEFFDEGKYIQDNLEGEIPAFMKQVGFKVKVINKRYRGVQFLIGTK